MISSIKKFIKSLLSYFSKQKAEHCLESFKDNKIEISPIGASKSDEEEAKKNSRKKYFTVLESSNGVLPMDYIKYLMSIEMKDNPSRCIENTLPFLVVTLFLTLIFALIFSCAQLHMKKIIFFSTSLSISLSLNYILIKIFYDYLHTTKNSHEGIHTYILSDERNEDGASNRVLLKYQESTIEFGKIYPYFMGAYFAIIITFTFYSASLMPR